MLDLRNNFPLSPVASGMPVNAVTINLTTRCVLACSYCNPAGTPILMADMTYKPIEEVQMGDVVLGFDRDTDMSGAAFISAVVEGNGKRLSSLIKVTTDRGDSFMCTPDHKWFNGRSYMPAKVGMKIGYVSDPVYTIDDLDYKLGYIQGLMAGDGTFADGCHLYKSGQKKGLSQNYHHLRLCLKDREPIDRVQQYLLDLELPQMCEFEFKDGLFGLRTGRMDLYNILDEYPTIYSSENHLRGWLAGIFDAEGSFEAHNLRITQQNTNRLVCSAIKLCLERLGFEYSENQYGNNNMMTYRIKGGNADHFRFMALVKPAIRRKVDAVWQGKTVPRYSVITEIEEIPSDRTMVYSLQTSAGNYIAHGHTSKNCFSGCFKEYEGHDLDEDLAFRIIDWVMDPQTHGENESVDVSFWGGEPLMKWDLLKKIVLYAEEKAREAGIEVTFGGTTNVVLLTEDKFDFMDEHKIHFLLSCDGIERHHDQFRKFKNGTGSWKTVDENITRILQRWPMQEVRLSYTAENIEELRQDIDYFVDKGFRYIIYSPVAEGDWTPEKLESLRQVWQEIAEWYITQRSVTIKFIEDSCQHLTGRPTGSAAPCGAGRNYLGINYDGSIYPCVPPGSLVETELGPKRIETLYEGVSVLTHQGRHRKVTKVWNKIYHGDLHHIETVIFPESQFTPEHPIYVLRDNKPDWIDAKDVEMGDYLIYPIYHHPYMGLARNIVISESPINRRKLFLLGRMLSAARSQHDPYVIQTRSFIERGTIRRALREFGIESRKHKDGTMRFDSTKLSEWFHEAFWFGKQEEARLPIWMNWLDKGHIESFLDGLFWEDSICIGSKTMADQVKNLILRSDKIPTLEFVQEEGDDGQRLHYFKVSRHDSCLGARIENGYLYALVVGNHTSDYHGEVYNLEVKDDNSYVLSNVTAHNCHRFCKFEDGRPWYEQEVCLGHIDYGILNHPWRDQFVDWDSDRDCPDKCQSCSAFKVSCNGGCWATNLDLNGDIALAPEINCVSTLATMDQARYVLQNRPNDSINILPEVQGCQCYNVQDHLYGRYRQNDAEPYRCLCNMTSYGDEPKPVRSCTCYNIENNGRGYFDQSGQICEAGYHKKPGT